MGHFFGILSGVVFLFEFVVHVLTFFGIDAYESFPFLQLQLFSWGWCLVALIVLSCCVELRDYAGSFFEQFPKWTVWVGAAVLAYGLLISVVSVIVYTFSFVGEPGYQRIGKNIFMLSLELHSVSNLNDPELHDQRVVVVRAVTGGMLPFLLAPALYFPFYGKK